MLMLEQQGHSPSQDLFGYGIEYLAENEPAASQDALSVAALRHQSKVVTE